MALVSDKELSTLRAYQSDFYSADQEFISLLKALSPDFSSLDNKLKSFSQKCSGPWDAMATDIAHNYDGPHIEHYDQNGNPTDTIWLPPPVRQMRREVVEAGVFDNRSQIEQFAKVYFLSHLGETSVTCPLACTEGLIRSVEAVGSDFLKKNYLPKLKSAQTPLAGAQFITEQDMGSDVGALVTEAKPDGEGRFRLTGEKWFCSAIDEFFLIAARPPGAPAGTDGVAVFLVPRIIDGKLNNLHIKRLKEKIGTRELPTAEIELNGALGFNIGPVENGFKTLMIHVLNTSRVMNAASGLGMSARAYLEGKNYAEQRSTFGTKIINYPLVQESLLKMRSILSTKRALFFHLLSTLDQKSSGEDENLWRRFLINLCKTRTAIGATDCTHEAILLLGGNGTIETFSPLPRLYRDSMVIETWEGTHNVLALQIARDSFRFRFKDFLAENIIKRAEKVLKTNKAASEWISEGWEKVSQDLDQLKNQDWAARNARKLVDRLASLLEISVYAELAPKLNNPQSDKIISTAIELAK